MYGMGHLESRFGPVDVRGLRVAQLRVIVRIREVDAGVARARGVTHMEMHTRANVAMRTRVRRLPAVGAMG